MDYSQQAFVPNQDLTQSKIAFKNSSKELHSRVNTLKALDSPNQKNDDSSKRIENFTQEMFTLRNNSIQFGGSTVEKQQLESRMLKIQTKSRKQQYSYSRYTDSTNKTKFLDSNRSTTDSKMAAYVIRQGQRLAKLTEIEAHIRPSMKLAVRAPLRQALAGQFERSLRNSSVVSQKTDSMKQRQQKRMCQSVINF